jgi:hypothetical protein
MQGGRLPDCYHCIILNDRKTREKILIILNVWTIIIILEQRTGKARYQGTTENSCIGHSTHTAGSANVEAQKGLILRTVVYAPLTVRAG